MTRLTDLCTHLPAPLFARERMGEEVYWRLRSRVYVDVDVRVGYRVCARVSLHLEEAHASKQD